MKPSLYAEGGRMRSFTMVRLHGSSSNSKLSATPLMELARGDTFMAGRGVGGSGQRQLVRTSSCSCKRARQHPHAARPFTWHGACRQGQPKLAGELRAQACFVQALLQCKRGRQAGSRGWEQCERPGKCLTLVGASKEFSSRGWLEPSTSSSALSPSAPPARPWMCREARCGSGLKLTSLTASCKGGGPEGGWVGGWVGCRGAAKLADKPGLDSLELES